jgi:small subunit ribosomal protein S20
MAHSNSAKKRIRQSNQSFLRNKARRTRVRNAIKAVRAAIESKDLEAAQKEYARMVPIIDKMASFGLIHKNVAARTKSRLNKHITVMSKPSE